MGFIEAVRSCFFDKYVTFSGRASRSEYWYFALFYFLIFFVLSLLFMLFGGSVVVDGTGELPTLAWLPVILMGVFGLAMFLPLISVSVRRFHDRNLSGWWYLGLIVVGVIPVVGIIGTIASFVITVLKGTPGPNKFGRDPLGADTSADIFA